jgi:hypothetical protein
MLLPEVMLMSALGIVVSAGLVVLLVRGGRRWRLRRVAGDLRLFYGRAHAAHEKVRAGLRAMARIVPHLEDPRLHLARRAVELLDRHAVSMLEVERTLVGAHGRSRFRRLATRQLQDLSGLDSAFERFQQAVLVSLYQDAVARVVLPPLAVRRYRVAFTVLEHDLPGELWPLMNEILARHVELWVREGAGGWHKVRGLGIRLGKELVFSRRCLEHALELHLIVRDPDGRTFTNEFEIEHERPLQPGRWRCVLNRLRHGH